MKASFAIVGGVLFGWGLAGCVATGGADRVPAAALAVPAPVAAPVPVSRGPLLDGPVGLKLQAADREVAFKAEVDALSSGNRRTWRGDKGVYGFVVPDTAAAEGGCRSFTHTIYFSGRPQTGHGTGCRDPDGSWRITG